VIATIIPITTNTTIATCIQIHVGDIAPDSVLRHLTVSAGNAGGMTIVWPMRLHMSRFLRLSAPASAICALACLGPVSAGASAGRAHASSRTLLGGLNVVGLGYDSTLSEADHSIAVAKQVKARVVRVEIPWATLEPREGKGIDPAALAYTDRLMNNAEAARIKVIMTVERTPCWASSAPPAMLRKCRPGQPSQASAWPPRSSASYAAIVAYLAKRYGSKLAAIEVWSEPDQTNEAYFAGPDKPGHYTALLKAAYPAIKRANPRVTVLGGSLTGSNGLFLKALYADGIKGYYDGLSVHYYNLTLASVRSIHEIQLAAGDTKPIWLDEFGWSSCWPHQKTQQEQGCVTTATQALNLTNTFRQLARAPYVAAAVVYKLQDSGHEDFGLLAASGAHKPSFAGLTRALSTPLGPVSKVSLALRLKGSRLLATGSGPVGDYMQLEAFAGATLRYRVLFTLDRFNRYSVALPSVLGTKGLRVRVFQYWTGAGHSAQKNV
jgi:hypothetical protein